MTLLETVKQLAKELNAGQPDEYFEGLSEVTLGYLLISMQVIKRYCAQS